MAPSWTRASGSYRVRVLVAFALVATVLTAAWAWSLTAPLGGAIVEQQRRQLLAVARAGTLLTQNAQPQSVAAGLSRETGTRVTIVAEDGTVLADSESDPAAMENHADRPEVAAALDGRTGEDQRVSATEGNEQLYLAVPATVGGAPAALRVSQKVATIDDVVGESRRLGLVILLAAFAVTAVVAVRASGALAGPVAELVDASKSMAAGNLGTPIPQPSGELGVLADALVDLRDQMRTRIGDLETEEQNLRQVLDGLQECVWLLEDDRIRFANRASSEFFKEPAAGWLDRSILRSGLPASLQTWISDALYRAVAASEVLPSDPTGRTLRATFTPLSNQEKGRALVVVSDVTEVARLDRIRRDFVANASHELKTPVAGIHLLAQSAAQAAADGDDQQARDFSEQIERESGRLQQLVKDLLDLSRLEGPPAPDSIADVRAAVDNALVGHQAAADLRSIELSADFSAVEGVDVYVAADPTDLAVALDNLLDNAIVYTEQGGATVRVFADDAQVRIAVTDTGIGIPEEDLPRVFERFYRVDRSRSRLSGGTGLGLALVRHAAERAGGSVTAESKVGSGSTFTLLLPRAS